MNEGKKFEQDFKKSLDQHTDLWVYRPSDFGGGQSGRFTNVSLCDYIVFNTSTQELYLLELKSVQGKSISCPSCGLMNIIHNLQSDINNKKTDDVKAARALLKEHTKKANTYNIKYHQIADLKDIENTGYKHVNVYFIINFRDYDKTYYCTPMTLISILLETKKSSINISDFDRFNIKTISQSKNRTRQHYDIGELLCQNKQK